MSMPLRSLLRVTRALLAGWLLVCGATASHAVDELDLKAAIVANLLAFADWPAQAAPSPNGALVLCVGPQQALRAPLATLNGRVIRQWLLQVRELAPADAIAQCHALLVDDALLAERPALRRELRTLPVLSFSDAAQAADAAVCIRLELVNGRIGFMVDLATARSNGLVLSSRLLRLAREVRE
jgi:hypothetical protein